MTAPSSLDPRQFWLVDVSDSNPTLPNHVAWFALKDRLTGIQFAPPSWDIPKDLPNLFSPCRLGDGTKEAWWTVFKKDLPQALARAQDFGFRRDADDVAKHGDPGLVLPQAMTRLIAGVETMRGRPGQHPYTLVRGAQEHISPYGESDADLVTPQTLLTILGKGTPVRDDYADAHASGIAFPGTLDEAWALLTAAGYVPHSKFPACLRPDQMYAFIDSEDDETVDTVVLWAKEQTVWDDDLRDGAVAWLPAVLGNNIAESTWAPKTRMRIVDMQNALVQEGYTLSNGPFD